MKDPTCNQEIPALSLQHYQDLGLKMPVIDTRIDWQTKNSQCFTMNIDLNPKSTIPCVSRVTLTELLDKLLLCK